jgi:hypothetical protein
MVSILGGRGIVRYVILVILGVPSVDSVNRVRHTIGQDNFLK